MNGSLARFSAAAFLAGAAICISNAASADGYFGLKASDCQIPGVIAWFSGNAISSGMSYNPCPNPIPLPVAVPAAPAPVPVDTPAAAPAPVDTPAAAQDDTPSPVAADTSSPAPVVVAPPPHVRIPVAVPTYAPSSATTGPGANAVGGGKATDSYYNPSNAVAPTSRAVVNGADWCRRSDRSKAAMDACLKSVAGR